MVTVAVSGSDNAGKSTQLRILARRMGTGAVLLGRLDECDPRWQQIVTSGMAEWWFEQSSVDEVADVLACSYLERARQAHAAGLLLADRGMPMLEASVAATVAVREELAAEAAVERATVLLGRYEMDIRRTEAAEFQVLLLHDRDPASATAASLAREASVTPVYASYQRHLHDQLGRLERDGRFATSIVTGARPIMEIQAELRSVLRGYSTDIPACRLPEVTAVALGGMSESGKSTAAEHLRVTHGFARLKIGYLIELAAGLCGIADPYAADDVTQAELLADGLDRYCAAHHFLDKVTIESLHRYGPVAELRKLLGRRLMIVYLQTPEKVRQHRVAEDAAAMRARDGVKRERGAKAIASIADEVLGNEQGLLTLYRSLDRLVRQMQWPQRRPSVIPAGMLGLPVHLESFLNGFTDRLTVGVPGVDLIAVTGSGARGKYQHGWSDLDVLVIAPTAAIPAVQDALEELRAELAGVKLGITGLTAAECKTGMVTPRLLHILAQLGRSDIGCLWCRPGMTLPVPDEVTDARESLRDGIGAAIEIRRHLLRPVLDLWGLYKVTGLLAKVMLRFEGTECPSDEEALRMLTARFACIDAADVDAARDDPGKARLLAGAVLGSWLATVAANQEDR
jgi:hypothetical protein